ncbi:MBL fold metallo-hydrolase [Gammaproteobacteria bacterium]|nr:MBL fold metallo-hydrolase [Gammaproteobacteria bacterium]
MTYRIYSEICGPWENFSHIIEDVATKKVMIIDPAWQPELILERISKLNLIPSVIFLTHAHHDHVNGIAGILEQVNIPVHLSDIEINLLKKHPETQPFGAITAQTLSLYDNDIYMLGATKIKVIHTPGHSCGSSCFLLENDMITGDTLFIDGVGRTDFADSSTDALFESLQKIVSSVPHHVNLHTGHAYGSSATATLASQLITNPYLQRINQNKRADFADYRSSH